MLRIFAVQVPLYGITVVLGAALQARRSFLWPALAPLVSSLVVMGSYVVYSRLVPVVAEATTVSRTAVDVLAWGTTAGVVAMALTVGVPACRGGLRLRPRLRLPRETARRAAALGLAGVGGIGAQQLTLGLVLLLAMRAGGTGTLPIFQYAQAVYMLPFAILIMPIVTSVFPQLSELRLVGDARGFARTAVRSMRVILIASAVGAAVLVAAAPAIEHFFRMVDRAGVSGVGATVAALGLGLAPYAVMTHATRILSAAHRAGDALLTGSLGWGIAAVLIVAVVELAPTRRAAEASASFGLCIAVGMTVAAIVGLARAAAVIDEPDIVRPLARSSAAAAVALVGGAVVGYLISRPLVSGSLGVLPTVLVGALAAAAGSDA